MPQSVECRMPLPTIVITPPGGAPSADTTVEALSAQEAEFTAPIPTVKIAVNPGAAKVRADFNLPTFWSDCTPLPPVARAGAYVKLPTVSIA